MSTASERSGDERTRRRISSVIDSALGRVGYERKVVPPDLEGEFLELYGHCAPYTMTSIERMYSLYQAVKYIERRNVTGDIVECGVWRGGSSMMAALTLEQLGNRERHMWLYDTFAGMAEPTEHDGSEAYEEWAENETESGNAWCYGALSEVRQNLYSTGVAAGRLTFVEGKVEDTLPNITPERIALLRLDTDWYSSTLHELEHLYPRLEVGGVLIIDDYGHWEGARTAVDEYFADHG